MYLRSNPAAPFWNNLPGCARAVCKGAMAGTGSDLMRCRCRTAGAGGLLVLACVFTMLCLETPNSVNHRSALYPEHMVDRTAQYGFGYGKPGIGYGPTVWAEERRQGERNRFPWPMSSNRWWKDRSAPLSHFSLTSLHVCFVTGRVRTEPGPTVDNTVMRTVCDIFSQKRRSRAEQ